MPNNSKVIHFVVITVCLGATICVGTQAYCYINKVPDMNTPLAGAFIHITDTLIGALIAMLINTRPQTQQQQTASTPIMTPSADQPPTPVVVTNPPSQAVPVTESPKP